MASKRIEKLLIKYLINQASFSELDELEIYIKDPINEREFINYVKTNYAIEYNLKKIDRNKTKDIIDNLIKEEKRVLKIRRIQKFTKYAAVFVGVLISVFIFKDELFNSSSNDNSTPAIVNNKIEPGTDKATLTLEDGSVVALEKGNTYQTQNASSNGEEIVYNPDGQNPEEVAYNYLTIPRGGQFFIKLSDGTQVWLNSESQFKYPVSFREGETRQVELVYGEAYFDVSPSTRHQGSKFKVFNQSQEIEVLGTEFNIKAYKDEANIYTTLVEGKVSVNTSTVSQLLKPAQQTNLNLQDSTISIISVDVYNEISWKEGVFSFEEKPLKEIMKVLSRWYDIDVVFKNVAIEDEEFMGVLGKDQNIEEILSSIKNFGIIKSYQINDKEVILE